MESKGKRDHGYQPGTSGGDKKADSGEVDKIVERLYNTKTKCIEGATEEETPKAVDVISKGPRNKGDAEAIGERLYKTSIKSRNPDPNEEIKADDIISKKVKPGDADSISERLFSTYTECSTPRREDDPDICTNAIAREPASEEELKEIFERLLTSHTISSKGGIDCKPWDQLKQQGLGQKMLPIIEGLEKRFAGKALTEAECKEIMARLLTTQTCASQARKDNPKILLYPERTTLMNNVERIREYQGNGVMAKQASLQRREKWYN